MSAKGMLGVYTGSSGNGELVQFLRLHANPDKAVFYLDSVSTLLSGCRSQWATELGNGSEEEGAGVSTEGLGQGWAGFV